MSNVLLIAQWLSEHPNASVQDAIPKLVDGKRKTCSLSWSQVIRRLYTTTNIVWYELLGELPEPLKPCRALRQASCLVSGTKNVFLLEEVAQMVSVAPSVSPYADAFIRLLFSTGLRIAAAARLEWQQILKPDGCTVHTFVDVREKGNQRRWLVLPDTVRSAIARLTRKSPKVFPLSVRQLRNIFYKTCQRAGLSNLDLFAYGANKSIRRIALPSPHCAAHGHP